MKALNLKINSNVTGHYPPIKKIVQEDILVREFRKKNKERLNRYSKLQMQKIKKIKKKNIIFFYLPQ